MLGRGFIAAATLACALITTTTASAQQTLEAIKARGQLVCGIGTGVAGFGLPDSKGVWQGMDVDLCRGLATAIFNDPNKVRFAPLSSSTRFTALGAGEVDVLFRTSTQTMLRDVTLGLRHVTTYFYDGHGFIVKKDSVAKVSEMRDATICLVQGTTNEQVTADHFRSINTPFKPVLYERTDQATAALQAGRCDSFGTDASQLAGVKSTMANPKDWVILPERFSKEPYGAYIRRDDQQWFDVIRWYTTALIEAEEQGITRANAEEMRKTSVNPNTRRLLGVTPELGESLKLDRNWAYNAVKAMGNYGEIYDRSFGPDTQIDLARGPNKLWTQGGLIYALPMR
ncbi:amino acid ABC transporter substrate-binding protein [Dankookia sp. GCM10030260]|uniref:amino acid ABC transporter substrate-binding protein n=1 Tax=Dankookia sp. GCM10030260 TaxID=3273390 RepID=UPI0036206D38